jgi:hypothetical protein
MDVPLQSMELSVSSHLPMMASQLAEWFSSHNIAVEVHPLHSSVTHGKGYRAESGVRLVMFDTTPRTLRETVWPALQEKYGVQCGYIRTGHQYCGCVLNWPGVFRSSRCPGGSS